MSSEPFPSFSKLREGGTRALQSGHSVLGGGAGSVQRPVLEGFSVTGRAGSVQARGPQEPPEALAGVVGFILKT